MQVAAIPFDEFFESLTDLGGVVREDPALKDEMDKVVKGLRAIGQISRESLAQFVCEHPEAFPALVSCVGLGQEQLKNQLKYRFGTSGWITLARKRSDELVAEFDRAFGLVEKVRTQLNTRWTFADVLAERSLWSRRTGSKAVHQGRNLEDEVEALVKSLGFRYQMRCRFVGLGNQDAPCDLAIPAGGREAQIVIALKGNNSTGSKQGDAVREIEDMANKRLPTQFVYAVFDGIGWLSRRRDLERVYQLWETNRIDGLYSLAFLDHLEKDLLFAAQRLNIPRNVET